MLIIETGNQPFTFGTLGKWEAIFFFCPGTHQADLELRHPPASASQVIELKMCATTVRPNFVFYCIFCGPGKPGTHSIELASLEVRMIRLFVFFFLLGAEVKDLSHYHTHLSKVAFWLFFFPVAFFFHLFIYSLINYLFDILKTIYFAVFQSSYLCLILHAFL